MDPAFLFVQALNGLASASTLFIISAGLTLVFGVTRIVNFAHGSFYMLGAYLGVSIIPWQAAAADVRSKRLFCSRIAGHPLHRQTGWLYPKMSRLPRTVAEVIRVFEQIRPQFEAAVKGPA